MKKGSAAVYGKESRELIYELNHKLSLLEGEVADLDETGESTLSRKAQEYFLSYAGLFEDALERGEISRDEKALLESIGRGFEDYKKELDRALEEGKMGLIKAAKLEALREETLKAAMEQAMEDGVITEEERVILGILQEVEESGREKLGGIVPRLRQELGSTGRSFRAGELSERKYVSELKRTLEELDSYLKKVATLNKLWRHSKKEETWKMHVLRRGMEQELEKQRDRK